jgi:serine/threonine protein kinase
MKKATKINLQLKIIAINTTTNPLDWPLSSLPEGGRDGSSQDRLRPNRHPSPTPPFTRDTTGVHLSNFNLLKAIGRGLTGYVYKATAIGIPGIPDGQLVALKAIPKRKLDTPKLLEHLRREQECCIDLSTSGSPYIPKLLCSFHNETHVFLCFEHVNGGELADQMKAKPGGHFSEPETVQIAAAVIAALETIHATGRIHRDIKPRNILVKVDPDTKTGTPSLIDYGFSKDHDKGSETKTLCFTPMYAAPEALCDGSSSKASDVWSLGVLIFKMLTSCLPILVQPKDQANVMLVLKKIYTYLDEGLFCEKAILTAIDSMALLSADAKDLLSKILVRDPADRLSIAEIKAHPFFKVIDWDTINDEGSTATFDVEEVFVRSKSLGEVGNSRIENLSAKKPVIASPKHTEETEEEDPFKGFTWTSDSLTC